ncbi:hypothetical protein JX265_005863 [Neoarthrinium moseri]|uniref:Uncharacterized protein n=1 Tax=Neoarthrinium moseri TaxID=1658444 RepID=A0A9Q0APY4_9PEZI|nr:hypothetical protein JX266_005853 [Neoarthrinium moseri]KAI1871877.1 hypothetical protein JX265_005863 [Neoarthrinium moseri]
MIDAERSWGSYDGQQLNADTGEACSFSDPVWPLVASYISPSPNETSAVYAQNLQTPTGRETRDCCPISSKPGGQRSRLVIVRLSSRTQRPIPGPTELLPELCEVCVEYIPDSKCFRIPVPDIGISKGNFILHGKAGGSAQISAGGVGNSTRVTLMSVIYYNFTNDGIHILNSKASAAVSPKFVYHANITESGVSRRHPGHKRARGFTGWGVNSGNITTTITDDFVPVPLTATYISPRGCPDIFEEAKSQAIHK